MVWRKKRRSCWLYERTVNESGGGTYSTIGILTTEDVVRDIYSA